MLNFRENEVYDDILDFVGFQLPIATNVEVVEQLQKDRSFTVFVFLVNYRPEQGFRVYFLDLIVDEGAFLGEFADHVDVLGRKVSANGQKGGVVVFLEDLEGKLGLDSAEEGVVLGSFDDSVQGFENVFLDLVVLKDGVQVHLLEQILNVLDFLLV